MTTTFRLPAPSFTSLRRLAVAVLLPVVALSFGGCSTAKPVAQAKESAVKGSAHVYAVTSDEAWTIAREVLLQSGAQNLKEDRAAGYISASSSGKWLPWGTVMGAWVEKVTSSNTRVFAYTEERLPVSVGKHFTEEVFHQRFAAALETRRSGK